MEEILKNIYNRHSIKKQRERIQKNLENQQYLFKSPRKKYTFRDQMNIGTPATSMTIDDQVKFQKELTINHKQKQFQAIHAFIPFQNNFKLPKIVRNNAFGKYKRKFRVIVFTIIFIRRLKTAFQQNLIKLKQKADKSSTKLLKNIDRLVKEYYKDLLNNQLQTYSSILQRSIQGEPSSLDEEIMEVLFDMSSKLANSTVTQNILDFFILIATNKGFPPSDYLSYLEVSRLQFSPKYGYLMNVSTQQTRMLLGLGLGIKIFCFYVLYQPFTKEQSANILNQNRQKLQQLIQNFSSIFYYIIIDQFCLKLSQIKTKNMKTLSKFKISIIKPLNPLNLPQKSSQKEINNDLLLNINRTFFDKVSKTYADKMKKTKVNIQKWIQRVAYVCLKQAGNGKNINMDTIIPKGTRSNFKRYHKSVQIKKNRDYQDNLNQKKSIIVNTKYKFP